MFPQLLLLTVLFSTQAPLVSALCSSPYPFPGSNWSFSGRQCLTQEFMKSQFDAGNFGNEMIEYASNPTDLAYLGRSFPLAIESGWGWESGQVTPAIASILINEVLGVNTYFVCTWGSTHAMRLLGGCPNPNVGDSCLNDEGRPILDPPAAQLSPESWVTTTAERELMLEYAQNLGSTGYNLAHGLHLKTSIYDQALANGNVLSWWASYVAPHDASSRQYFDDYTQIDSDLTAHFNGASKPGCIPGSDGFIALQNAGFTCENGWFFSPACSSDKLKCIPVILAEYSWHGFPWVQAADAFNYPFAITWIGSQYSFSYGIESSARFLFYCSKGNYICNTPNVTKVFTHDHSPPGREDFVSGLRKTAWKGLERVNQDVNTFMKNLFLTKEDLGALMETYAHQVSNTGQPDEDMVFNLACGWIRNNITAVDALGVPFGANTARWAEWIPRICDPGSEFNTATKKCQECPANFQSPEGRTCAPCPDGQSSEAGAATCNSGAMAISSTILITALVGIVVIWACLSVPFLFAVWRKRRCLPTVKVVLYDNTMDAIELIGAFFFLRDFPVDVRPIEVAFLIFVGYQVILVALCRVYISRTVIRTWSLEDKVFEEAQLRMLYYMGWYAVGISVFAVVPLTVIESILFLENPQTLTFMTMLVVMLETGYKTRIVYQTIRDECVRRKTTDDSDAQPDEKPSRAIDGSVEEQASNEFISKVFDPEAELKKTQDYFFDMTPHNQLPIAVSSATKSTFDSCMIPAGCL